MADLLVDTDIFIDHLRGAVRLEPGRHRLHYSVVTRAELFAGSSATELAATLLGPFRELAVDRPVAERAGRIRREFSLRMPDALIAATAVEHGLALTTRNIRDFRPVRGLRLRSLRRTPVSPPSGVRSGGSPVAGSDQGSASTVS